VQNLIIELLKKEKSLNLKEIRKKLQIEKQKYLELNNILKKLELEGLIYCDEFNLYHVMPSNFFIYNVNISQKGNFYIEKDNQKIFLDPSLLKGILPHDTVLFEEINNTLKVKKVLQRFLKEVICVVKINKNNKKYLEVVNQKNKIYLRISHQDMLKLKENDYVLVKTSLEKTDFFYEGEFIKIIGSKNDFESELKSIIINNGFNFEFNEDILRDLENLSDQISDSELKKRIDKRNDHTFTIDEIDTKDIDDAIDIKRLANGNFLLTVSIANVSYYVKPFTNLWNLASYNTTSLYLNDLVFPLFPALLTKEICSLNEGVDRLSRSFAIEIDIYGEIVNFNTFLSVIKSKKKMTYEDLNKILTKKEISAELAEFKPDIKLLQELNNILINKYFSQSVDLTNENFQFIVDEDNVTKMIKKNDVAENIVSNCMIITNYCLALTYYYLQIPFIYRNHKQPYNINSSFEIIKKLNQNIPNYQKLKDPELLKIIIKKLKTKEEFIYLAIFLLKTMPKAYYSMENIGHFGLNLESYSQTTAPIRRFLDLVIHTIIDYHENNNFDYTYECLLNKLHEYCQIASIKEKLALKVEYEVSVLMTLQENINKINQEVHGVICAINEKFITIKTTDLLECIFYYNADHYSYTSISKMLIDLRGKNHIKNGDKVHGFITKIDLSKKEIIVDIDEIISKENLKRIKKKIN